MIRSIVLGGVLAALLAAPAAFSEQAGGPALATADFITAASQTDEFERQEGRLAEHHAHNPKIKRFAKMMVADHTKTTAILKDAIVDAHISIPSPASLTGDQTQMLSDLKTLHGPGFDKAYIDQQVGVHQKALGVMQAYAARGADAPIRIAAAKTVPIVQHHLAMAQDLQAGH